MALHTLHPSAGDIGKPFRFVSGGGLMASIRVDGTGIILRDLAAALKLLEVSLETVKVFVEEQARLAEAALQEAAEDSGANDAVRPD